MTMQVKEVMTRNVISIEAGASILKAARLMLQNHVSGLPVVDKEGKLIGIVTEGDFLRRSELGTQRRHPRWLQFIVGPGRLADEYVHASGRKVEEVMTPGPYTVTEDDSLEQLVELMQRRHIKRLPVMREGRLVGIVSRANLMHALTSLAREAAPSTNSDGSIRNQILSAIGGQHWAPNVNVVVRNGIVELWGVVMDEREREGIKVLVENVPEVKEVHDHLVWVEPMSGMVFPSAEDEAKERAAAS
jgi:CBS domain-containing protein